jgi:hypothetical protein
MAKHHDDGAKTLIHALGLASKLEGQGQYNVAKLLRAAVDAAMRRAAYEVDLPENVPGLAQALGAYLPDLRETGAAEGLIGALERGAAAMADGRLLMFDEGPDPYVCRTCGRVEMATPSENCPDCGAWPDTFQRFRPVYWLDAYEPLRALEVMGGTPEIVWGLIADLSEEQLSWFSADDQWSLRQAVGHLRDAQGVLAARIDLILERDNPPLEALAVFNWAADEGERPPSTQEVFDTYRGSREAVVDRLTTIPLRDWWRTGVHQEFGVVTLRQQVSYFTAHELTHLAQIADLRRQALEASG